MEMLQRLIRQVMRFIEDINALLGRGQHHPAAQRQIGQHQIMVCHDDVSIIHFAARLKKGAGGKVATATVGALAMIGRKLAPVGLLHRIAPAVAIAGPFTAAIRCGHLCR